MKIVGLKAENVKRLKAVEIVPNSNVVKVSGKNGNGKTSVIDSICLALGGDAAVKLTKTTRAIHNGAARADVTVDLGEYKITRSWTANDKTTLKVETADGKKVSSPQTLLDSFIGDLSFDPLEFINMKPADQVEALNRIIGFDPRPLDAKRKDLFDERTLVNRQVRDLTGTMKGMNSYDDEGLPEAELQAGTLMQEMEEAKATLAIHERHRRELDDMRQKCRDLDAERISIDEQIAELEARKEECIQEFEDLKVEGKAKAADVASLVDPDLDVIKLKMQTMDQQNVKIRTRREYLAAKAKLDTHEKKSSELTQQIEEIDTQKEAAIKNAKLPIDGLSIGPDGVEYNKVPLAQSSHAEQLRVTMGMGMAMNPNLRVMFIKDGDKFDSTSWAMVEEMAVKNDYQIWAEIVDESGKVGFYIEDGTVIADDAKPVSNQAF